MRSRISILLLFVIFFFSVPSHAHIAGSEVGIKVGDTYKFKRMYYSSPDEVEKIEIIELEIISTHPDMGSVKAKLTVYDENQNMIDELEEYRIDLSLDDFFTYSDQHYWESVENYWMDETIEWHSGSQNTDHEVSKFLGVRTFTEETTFEYDGYTETLLKEQKFNSDGILISSYYERITKTSNGEQVVDNIIKTELQGLTKFLSSPTFKIGLIVVLFSIISLTTYYLYGKRKNPSQ